MCALLSIEFIFISTLRLSLFLGVQSIFSMFNGAAVKESEGRRCRKIVHVVAVVAFFLFFPNELDFELFFHPLHRSLALPPGEKSVLLAFSRWGEPPNGVPFQL